MAAAWFCPSAVLYSAQGRLIAPSWGLVACPTRGRAPQRGKTRLRGLRPAQPGVMRGGLVRGWRPAQPGVEHRRGKTRLPPEKGSPCGGIEHRRGAKPGCHPRRGPREGANRGLRTAEWLPMKTPKHRKRGNYESTISKGRSLRAKAPRRQRLCCCALKVGFSAC